MTSPKNHFNAGISPRSSLLPFTLFVTAAIGLSFFSAVDINLLIAVGIVAMIGGSFLASDHHKYWNTIIKYFGSSTAITAALLWLVVGVYANILKEGHIVEGLVWAAYHLQLNSGAFIIVTFLFSGVFAISTGTGFGTISAMSLTLFPAGIAIGSDATLLGGAILSGAALGDSISPISDTAVIAATTQHYEDRRAVDIGSSVRHRLPIVLWASALTVVGYLLLGSWHTSSVEWQAIILQNDYKGLLLLITTIVVMLLAFRKHNIFTTLFIGIVLAIIIGLSAQIFQLNHIIRIDNGHVRGAIVDGISGMTNICLLLMVVVALSGLIIESGAMDLLTRKHLSQSSQSQRQAELIIFVIVAIAGILIAAVNTIANICIAPFVNDIGRQQHIHPHRRSAILATVICTFPFILPYGGCVLLLLNGIAASGTTVSLEATSIFLTALYPWILLICTLTTCFIHKKEHHESIDKTDT